MLPPDLAPRLAVYGVEGMLNQAEWMPLRAKLMALYRKLALVPGVPASWLPQVESELQRGNLVRPFPPTVPSGILREDIPEWLKASRALQGTWTAIAKDTEAAVNAFSRQRGSEGLRIVEDAVNRAAFWDSAYRTAVAIRDAPRTAVAGTLGGIQDVIGGLLLTALKSPLVWVAVGVGLVVFIGPSKVLRGAISKVK